jgi:hypothetical protein
MNAFRQALGMSHDEIAALPLGGSGFKRTATVFNELLANEAMLDWFSRKRQPLRFYGGATNTILGLYDEIFRNAGTGLDRFNRGAQARYDLGGGFGTSEVERLMGVRFVSADIMSPRVEDYDPEICIQTISADGKRRTADNTTRQAFLERQRAVVYLPFNVLSDSLPSNAESYGIVSTGFMTSTVRPHERQGGWKVRGAGLAHLGLSLHAVIRVVELAQKGKTVDLFTVQRASSRVFKYKTAFLAWRNGRLVDLITTTDNSRNRWTRTALDAIRQRINPSFRRYCKFLPSQ